MNIPKKKEVLKIALWLLTLDRSQNELKVQDEKISIAKSQYDDAETALEQIQTESEEIYIRNGEYSSKIENIRTEITDIESQIQRSVLLCLLRRMIFCITMKILTE